MLKTSVNNIHDALNITKSQERTVIQTYMGGVIKSQISTFRCVNTHLLVKNQATYRYLSVSANQKLSMSSIFFEVALSTSSIPAYALLTERYLLMLWVTWEARLRYLMSPVDRQA